MTSADFMNIVARFQERPVPGRKVYVWHGSQVRLWQCLPANIVQEMDLVKIIPEDIGLDADEIRRKMRKAIATELEKCISGLKGQQILVVSNAYLLARYRIPLSVFYAAYLSDRTMLVFLVPKQKVVTELPKYAVFIQDATLKYIQELLPNEHRDNIIKEAE